MRIFDKLFGKKEPLPEPTKPPEMPKVKKSRKPKEKKIQAVQSDKEKANT